MIKPLVRKHEMREALMHEERASSPGFGFNDGASGQLDLPLQCPLVTATTTAIAAEGRPENEEERKNFSDPRQLCLDCPRKQ